MLPDEQLEPRGAPPRVIWLTGGNTGIVALPVILAEGWPRIARVLAAGEPLAEISAS